MPVAISQLKMMSGYNGRETTQKHQKNGLTMSIGLGIAFGGRLSLFFLISLIENGK